MCSNWKGEMPPVKTPLVVTDEHIVMSECRLSKLLPDSVAKSVINLSGPKIYSAIPVSIAGIATTMETRASSRRKIEFMSESSNED